MIRLVSLLVGFIIRALKDDPLSAGVFDVFFEKEEISCAHF